MPTIGDMCVNILLLNMKRGIIELSYAEIDEIIKLVPPHVYEGTPLEVKLTAAMSSEIDNPIRLEVSSEELEVILDEIALPDPINDSEDLVSLRAKVQTKLIEFNENGN